MDNQVINVNLCNKETDFIHCYGVNTGSKPAVTKLLRCLFLSKEAKATYQTLYSYAYGNKKDCFPSVSRLSLNLDCDPKSVRKYLDELVDLGFLRKECRGVTSTNAYYFEELQNIAALRHSEIVYTFAPKDSRAIVEFKSLLKEYKETLLFDKIQQSEYPEDFMSEIEEWFGGTDKENTCEDSVREENTCEDSIREEGIRETKQPSRTSSFQKRMRLVKQVPEYDEMADINKVKRPRKKARYSYKEKEVKEWNCKNFLQYYNDIYEQHFGYRYGGGQAEEAMLKGLIYSKQNNEHIKKQIDIFLQSSGVFDVLSIQNFVFSKNQALLDTYIRTGSFPQYVYKKAKGVPQSTAGGVKEEDKNKKGLFMRYLGGSWNTWEVHHTDTSTFGEDPSDTFKLLSGDFIRLEPTAEESFFSGVDMKTDTPEKDLRATDRFPGYTREMVKIDYSQYVPKY